MALYQIRPFPAGDPHPDESGLSVKPRAPEPAHTAEGELPIVAQAAREPITTAQLNALLAERDRQINALNRQVADWQRRLMQLAEVLCPTAVDAETRQSGQSLETWTPERLIGFIADNARDRLLRADQATGQYVALHLAYTTLLGERTSQPERAPQAAEPPASPAPEAEAPPSRPAAPEPTPASPRADQTRVDDVVRVLATTGLVRGNHIREKLAALWGIDRRGHLINDIVEATSAAGFLQAHSVRADWPGAPSQFLELTKAGRERATRLGFALVPPENLRGVRRALSPELVNLVLQAADILAANGYADVCPFPAEVALPDGVTYVPMLSAKDRGGAMLYIECERERVVMPREARWRLAARVGGDVLHLITTSSAVQERLTTEINLVRVHAHFSIVACNVGDYLKGRRGPDESVWTYKRQD